MASDLRMARYRLNKSRVQAGQPPLALPTTTVSPVAVHAAQRSLAQQLDVVMKPPTFGGHKPVFVGPKGHQQQWRVPAHAKTLPTDGGSVVVRDATGDYHWISTRHGRVVELVDPVMMAKLRPELDRRFAKIQPRGDK